MARTVAFVAVWTLVGAFAAGFASTLMCENRWSTGMLALLFTSSAGEGVILLCSGRRFSALAWALLSPPVGYLATYVVGSLTFSIGFLLYVATLIVPFAGHATVPAWEALRGLVPYLGLPVVVVVGIVQSAILARGAPTLGPRELVLLALAGLSLGILIPAPGDPPMIACHPELLDVRLAAGPSVAIPAFAGALYGAFRGICFVPAASVRAQAQLAASGRA